MSYHYKIGDVVIVRHGNALFRDAEPAGPTKIQILEIDAPREYSEPGFCGLSLATDMKWSYEFREIISSVKQKPRIKGTLIGERLLQ